MEIIANLIIFIKVFFLNLLFAAIVFPLTSVMMVTVHSAVFMQQLLLVIGPPHCTLDRAYFELHTRNPTLHDQVHIECLEYYSMHTKHNIGSSSDVLKEATTTNNSLLRICCTFWMQFQYQIKKNSVMCFCSLLSCCTVMLLQFMEA